MKINLQKLEQQAATKLIEIDPKGKYLLAVDLNMIDMSNLERLKDFAQIKWIIGFMGKPNEAMSMYEVIDGKK